jgi:hypothetical protein
MKQLSITTENKPGQLNEICSALGGNGINIESLVGEGWKDVGLIRLITTDPDSAKKVLERKGFEVEVSDVFTIRIPDKPGELAKITKKLRDGSINIECIYLLNKFEKETEIAIAADKVEKAREILGL